MESTVPNRWSPTRIPLAKALLLSAGLHAAALALIQPAPGSDAARTIVISARLDMPTHAVERAAEPIPESNPAPAPSGPGQPAPDVPATPQASADPLPVVPAVETPAATSLPIQAPAPAPSRIETPAAGGPAPPGFGPSQASSLPALPLGIDTTWYLARQVDVQPRAVGRIEPLYPDAARRRNEEGSLRLMVKIDDLGRVLSAEVVEANPPGVFDEAALDAFRKARFQPAMKDGRPVRFQAYMRVDFRLED